MPNRNVSEYHQKLRADMLGGEYPEVLSRIIENVNGQDIDRIWRGDNDNSLLVLDAGSDEIGLGVLAPDAKVHLADTVRTSGTDGTLLVVGAAHTTLTASTESNQARFNFGQTVQWATGALTTQRAFRIDAPTYAFVGASTLTDAATFYVSAAPTAGTNATITRAHTVWVDGGNTRLDGDLSVGNLTSPGATLDVADTVVTTGTSAVALITGAAHTGMTASTEVNFVRFNLGQTVQWATGALTTERAIRVDRPTVAFVGASTLTTGVTLDIDGPPTAGTNATITNAIGLRLGGASTQVTASGLVYQSLQIPAHTLTLTGTTQVTSSAIASIGIGQLTITNTGAGTVDNAAGIYIADAPVAAGSAVVTNPYSLWVDAGNSRFDGRVCMAKGADVASGTTLTFGSDGNFFDITGTTTINHITTAGWTIGSFIILQFDGTVTVNHNAASPPAGTVPILLTGAAAFSATASDTLMLIYEGTTGFREVARTVI